MIWISKYGYRWGIVSREAYWPVVVSLWSIVDGLIHAFIDSSPNPFRVWRSHNHCPGRGPPEILHMTDVEIDLIRGDPQRPRHLVRICRQANSVGGDIHHLCLIRSSIFFIVFKHSALIWVIVAVRPWNLHMASSRTTVPFNQPVFLKEEYLPLKLELYQQKQCSKFYWQFSYVYTNYKKLVSYYINCFTAILYR